MALRIVCDCLFACLFCCLCVADFVISFSHVYPFIVFWCTRLLCVILLKTVRGELIMVYNDDSIYTYVEVRAVIGYIPMYLWCSIAATVVHGHVQLGWSTSYCIKGLKIPCKS